MDGGPFRSPQPAERRVPSRSEQAPRQPEPVQQAAPEEPRSSYRADPPVTPVKKGRSIKRILFTVITVVVLLGLALGGWTLFTKAQNSAASGIDTGKYQAVFFTNGEVYFGKLQSFNDKYMKLTDIFYLHSDTATASTDTDPKDNAVNSSDAQLIKLGNEAYGPEDAMIISRDQVSRYMNLKPDSKVVQLIDKYVAK